MLSSDSPPSPVRERSWHDPVTRADEGERSTRGRGDAGLGQTSLVASTGARLPGSADVDGRSACPRDMAVRAGGRIDRYAVGVMSGTVRSATGDCAVFATAKLAPAGDCPCDRDDRA